MAGIYDFDAKSLDILLDTIGLRKTWISILARHIEEKPQLEYILNDKVFQKAKKIKVDLINGLSIGEIGVLYE
jgi:glycerol-3-phosphate responsive antiterminator